MKLVKLISRAHLRKLVLSNPDVVSGIAPLVADLVLHPTTILGLALPRLHNLRNLKHFFLKFHGPFNPDGRVRGAARRFTAPVPAMPRRRLGICRHGTSGGKLAGGN